MSDQAHTEDRTEPPALMKTLRRAVDASWGDHPGVFVQHGHVDEPGSYGWNTVLSPAGRGSEVFAWFDGFDRDLMLMVDGEYYVEWLDLEDADAVVADVVGILSAVVVGDLAVRRVGRRRYLDLRTTSGRRTVEGGRDSRMPWRRAVQDGRRPGYDGSDTVETTCRVCGFDEGDDRWTGPGLPNYVICSCCGAESGVEDLTLAVVRRYRERWQARGCPWFDPRDRPEGWLPGTQEALIPFGWA